MKDRMKWKRAAIVMMSAIMVSGSTATVPVMAHGHGGGHHSIHQVSTCVTVGSSHCSSSVKSSKKGTYCSYHEKYHKKKSSCKKYCKKHKTTHSNGKKHHVNHH